MDKTDLTMKFCLG